MNDQEMENEVRRNTFVQTLRMKNEIQDLIIDLLTKELIQEKIDNRSTQTENSLWKMRLRKLENNEDEGNEKYHEEVFNEVYKSDILENMTAQEEEIFNYVCGLY